MTVKEQRWEASEIKSGICTEVLQGMRDGSSGDATQPTQWQEMRKPILPSSGNDTHGGGVAILKEAGGFLVEHTGGCHHPQAHKHGNSKIDLHCFYSMSS